MAFASRQRQSCSHSRTTTCSRRCSGIPCRNNGRNSPKRPWIAARSARSRPGDLSSGRHLRVQACLSRSDASGHDPDFSARQVDQRPPLLVAVQATVVHVGLPMTQAEVAGVAGGECHIGANRSGNRRLNLCTAAPERCTATAALPCVQVPAKWRKQMRQPRSGCRTVPDRPAAAASQDATAPPGCVCRRSIRLPR